MAMNTLPEPEQLNYLVEEITSIIAERRFRYGVEMLRMRHEIGRAVLDSPLYRKSGKGQGVLLKRVANMTELGERSIRYCTEFATRFPIFDVFMQKWDGGTKLPVWRDVVKSLPSGERKEEEKVERCKHCFHCPN